MQTNESETLDNEINCLKEGIRRLYETKEFADVSFSVGSQKFTAHKLILAARCSEFAGLVNKNSISDIIIEDDSVTAIGFEILLRFIYTDNLDTADKKSIVQAYLAAIYFKQNALKRKCEDLMNKWSITDDEVCELLNVSLKITVLQRRCLEFIKRNALKIISSGGFFNLSYAAMVLILENNALKDVKLKTRIVKIIEWGRKKVENPDDFVAVREYFLKFNPPLLGRLEMGELNIEELNDIFNIEYCGLLKPDEFTKIMRYCNKKDKSILPEWYKK